jgi:hypothetical protein
MITSGQCCNVVPYKARRCTYDLFAVFDSDRCSNQSIVLGLGKASPVHDPKG